MTDLVDHYLRLRPMLRDDSTISTGPWFDQLQTLVSAYAADDDANRDAVDEIVRDPEQMRFLMFSRRAAERAVERRSPGLIDVSIWALVLAGLQRPDRFDRRDVDLYCPLPFKSGELIGLDIRPRVTAIADEAGGPAREYLARWSSNDIEAFLEDYGWTTVERDSHFEYQSRDAALGTELMLRIGPLDRKFEELEPALMYDPVVSGDLVGLIVELLRSYQQASPPERRSLENAFRVNESRAMRSIARQFVGVARTERAVDWLELGLLALIVSSLQRPDRFDPDDFADDLKHIADVAQALGPEGLQAIKRVRLATEEPARHVLDRTLVSADTV